MLRYAVERALAGSRSTAGKAVNRWVCGSISQPVRNIPKIGADAASGSARSAFDRFWAPVLDESPTAKPKEHLTFGEMFELESQQVASLTRSRSLR
jgi:hypothetical protein